MTLNKTKRDVFKLQQHLMDTVYFFHSANSLTLNPASIKIVYCDNLSTIIKYITKKKKIQNLLFVVDSWRSKKTQHQIAYKNQQQATAK